MSAVKVKKLVTTIQVGNELGEGVQWDDQNQLIWWTDILEANLYSYSIDSQEIKKHPMPERVGCFAFKEGSQKLVVAFASGFALYDIATSQVEWLARPELHLSGNRFNDGCVDRQGRFWAGTMAEDEDMNLQAGSLYRLNADSSCTAVIDKVNVSNGLCWSPDGTTMYFADSPNREIYQYDFDGDSGAISNKRVFASTVDMFPDGSTVDADGGVWNAQWGGSRVVRYTTEGNVDVIVDTPVTQPTCSCFAGPNLDLLVVTSAKVGLSEEELSHQAEAGNVFIYQVEGVSGVLESRVK